MLLDARVDIGEGADGAGDCAGCHLRTGVDEAVTVAGHLGIEAGEGQAHGRRLGMDAMAAADAHCVLVLEGAGLQGCQHAVHVGDQMSAARTSWMFSVVSSTSDEVMPWWTKRESGPMNSARCVRKAMTSCLVTPRFRRCGRRRIRRGHPFPRWCGRIPSDHAEIGERVAGMGLDLEPDPELGFGGPDGDHFRPE